MNELEQLNERIGQLTELVKTGSEAIKSMEAALKAAEEERDRLADQRREQEPKFERCNNG
jgi:chromosome segregation ATPase